MNKSFSIVKVSVNTDDCYTASSTALMLDEDISVLTSDLETWRREGVIKTWRMTVSNHTVKQEESIKRIAESILEAAIDIERHRDKAFIFDGLE